MSEIWPHKIQLQKKIKFAINVGKRITLTLRNVKKKEAKCVNCHGKHASNDKSCPKWKEEKDIQRIKAERGISYTDAKKQNQHI